MKCKILHESSGRLRIRVKERRMSLSEADKLETYLRRLEGVKTTHVNERTMDAVICFKPSKRDAIIRALSEYDKNETEVTGVDHNGRVIKREFQDKMFFHIAGRLLRKVLFPSPLRTVWALGNSVPYFIKGVKCIRKGKLEVPVLDMTSIAVSMIQRDFNTASNIMFLLKLGDIIEDWTHRKSIADLAEAMSVGVDKVWVRLEDGTEVLESVASVREGDIVVVRAGSQIPLDGEVAAGEAMVNQASMTGE